MHIACSAVSHAHAKKTPVVSSILNTELLAIEQHPSCYTFSNWRSKNYVILLISM